jgi:hypothetical protein
MRLTSATSEKAMPVEDFPTVESLWNEVLGKNYRGGQHESLLRSLCWGNSSWEAMEAFIKIVQVQGEQIAHLQAEIDYLKDLIDG